jgi:ATP-dependent Clp protease ATP-binding subunit ClpC
MIRRQRRADFLDAFSPAGRRVLVLSQEVARQLDHGVLGTEHLLLGLLSEDLGMLTEVMASAGVSYDEALASVRRIDVGLSSPPTESPPLTPRAESVVSLAIHEADVLHHPDVGPEHILLGILQLGSGVATEVLADLAVNTDELRTEVERPITS